MSKLTRARVPMCPECGAEMDENLYASPVYSCQAVNCHRRTNNPHLGLYVPDVAGVVKRMKTFANDGSLAGRIQLAIWVDELEGNTPTCAHGRPGGQMCPHCMGVNEEGSHE